MFLFWTQKVEPGAEPTGAGWEEFEDAPPLLLHVTGACFTERVTKNSRTVVILESSDSKGPICVLNQGSNESQSLDLVIPFDTDEHPEFTLSGTNTSPVCLTGYVQPQQTMEDLMDDEDEELSERMAVDLDEESPDVSPRRTQGRKRNLAEVSEDSDAEPPELVEPAKKKQKKNKKKKKQQKQQNNGDFGADEEEAKVPSSSPRMSPKVEAAMKKSPRNSPRASPTQTPTGSEPATTSEPSGKKKKKSVVTMKGGLKYKDLRLGTGAKIRKSQTAFVYYVGQLVDKTVFDKCIAGDPFSFRLGGSEVIKGWDEGIAGMQVGGKRRLTVPSKLAYGAAGSPPKIPPNAQLTFTIEMKSFQ